MRNGMHRLNDIHSRNDDRWSDMRRTTIFGVPLAALALFGSAGVANAAPDLSPLVNTTCSYDQVVAALNAESPEYASQLNGNPFVQSIMKQFLASSADGRQQMLQEGMAAKPNWQAKLNSPKGQQQQALVLQVARTCNSY